MSRPVRSRPASVTKRLNSPRRNHTHLTASCISLPLPYDVKNISSITFRWGHHTQCDPMGTGFWRNYPENFQTDAWDILSRQSYTKAPTSPLQGRRDVIENLCEGCFTDIMVSRPGLNKDACVSLGIDSKRIFTIRWAISLALRHTHTFPYKELSLLTYFEG